VALGTTIFVEIVPVAILIDSVSIVHLGTILSERNRHRYNGTPFRQAKTGCAMVL
jgi:hypothetical protein